MRVFWILEVLVTVVSAATLALALVGWVRYRRRRADLDAREAMGELLARLANSRRGHRP